jgi:molybdopterin-guanine dinucleotide biosynthesis protein A
VTLRPPAVAAIVLAGGRAARFGSDKLAHPLGGTTVLAATVDAVTPLVDEVVVVLAPGAPVPDLSPRRPLRVARDPEPHPGPLVGLVAGLAEARAPLVLVVGGDMPWIRPDLCSLLLATLREEKREAAALMVGDALRPLPAALRRRRALTVLARVVAKGSRSLQAGLQALATVAVPEAAWRPLDPDGASLRDVDRPEDLAGGERPAGGHPPDAPAPPGAVSRASPAGSSRSSRRGDRGGA